MKHLIQNFITSPLYFYRRTSYFTQRHYFFGLLPNFHIATSFTSNKHSPQKKKTSLSHQSPIHPAKPAPEQNIYISTNLNYIIGRCQFTILESYATKLLNKIRIKNPCHHHELMTTYKVNPKKLVNISLFYLKKTYIHSDSNHRLVQLLNKSFCTKPTQHPLKEFLNFLFSMQIYSVSTMEAGGNVPLIGWLIKKLNFRHSYITIYNSPFANTSRNTEVLEFSPGVFSNEFAREKVHGRYNTVPGFVILSLHNAGIILKKSNAFTLIRYRPFYNDCKTFTNHLQKVMNLELTQIAKEAQQAIITQHRYVPDNMPPSKAISVPGQKFTKDFRNQLNIDRPLGKNNQTFLESIFKKSNQYFLSTFKKPKDRYNCASAQTTAPLHPRYLKKHSLLT